MHLQVCSAVTAKPQALMPVGVYSLSMRPGVCGCKHSPVGVYLAHTQFSSKRSEKETFTKT